MTAPKAPGAGGPAEVAGGADPAGPADLSNAGGLAAPAGPTSTAGTAYAVDPNELAGRLRTVVLRMSHQLRGPVDRAERGVRAVGADEDHAVRAHAVPYPLVVTGGTLSVG